MFKMQEILELDNACKTFFNNYDKTVPIILFGSGGGGIEALRMFAEHNVFPVAICDNNSRRWGKRLNNIEIMSFQEALEKFMDFFVFISAPCFAEEIIEDLKEKIPEDRILFFGTDKRINIPEYKKYLRKNEKYLMEFYDCLEDEKSKKTFENFFSGWISCDYQYFKKSFTKNQYFTNEVLDLSEDEVFVDIGAYIGDSTEEFIRNTNGKYKKIYMIEPNINNISKLNDIQQRCPNIVIINKGVYNSKQELHFENEDVLKQEASHLIFTNNKNLYNKVEVDKIDNMIKEPITFIKMDIEGAEYAALEGAVNTIKKYKPKLAICVYHKTEDIIEISKFIRNIDRNYKLYLRHHSSFFGETVLYAL